MISPIDPFKVLVLLLWLTVVPALVAYIMYKTDNDDDPWSPA